jgi:hypothetical protein
MSGHLGDLSPLQQQGLDKMKERLEHTLQGELLEVRRRVMDDQVILRFLRARKFDHDQAFEMIYTMLKFRTEFQGISVAGINPSVCLNELKAGKSYFYNYDKHGRPVSYITARLHDPYTSDSLENQRFTLLQMEYARSLMRTPGETATLIFDMTGAAYKNIDLNSVKFMVNSLANYYPETLGQVLVYDAPWIVNGAWKIIKPWLDPVTAAKVLFINKGTLPEYIPLENLAVEYGGKSPFKYDYETYRAQIEKVIPSPTNAM